MQQYAEFLGCKQDPLAIQPLGSQPRELTAVIVEAHVFGAQCSDAVCNGQRGVKKRLRIGIRIDVLTIYLDAF